MEPKSIIYPQMKKMSLKNLYKYKMLMFTFKNKETFQVKKSLCASRAGGGQVAGYVGCSRLQSRYKGVEIFNKLPEHIRNQEKIGLFKKEIRKFLDNT